MLVHGLTAGHHGDLRALVLGFLIKVQGEHHVIHGQGRAVVEGHVIADHEGVIQAVLADGIGLGDPGLRFLGAVGIHIHQRIIELIQHVQFDGGRIIHGMQGVDVRVHSDHQVGLLRQGRTREQGRQHGSRYQQGQQLLHVRFLRFFSIAWPLGPCARQLNSRFANAISRSMPASMSSLEATALWEWGKRVATHTPPAFAPQPDIFMLEASVPPRSMTSR